VRDVLLKWVACGHLPGRAAGGVSLRTFADISRRTKWAEGAPGTCKKSNTFSLSHGQANS